MKRRKYKNCFLYSTGFCIFIQQIYILSVIVHSGLGISVPEQEHENSRIIFPEDNILSSVLTLAPFQYTNKKSPAAKPFQIKYLDIFNNTTVTNDTDTTLYEFTNNSSPDDIQIIQKCCGGMKTLSAGLPGGNSWNCLDSNDSMEGEFQLEIFRRPYDENSTGIFTGDYSIGIPSCREQLSSLINGQEIWFRQLESGELVVGLHFWMWPVWLPVAQQQYCVDEFQTTDSDNATRNSQILLFCSIDGYDTYYRRYKIINLTAFMISVVSLILTLIIYKIAQLSSNFHSSLQISYFMANLMFFSIEGARIFYKLDGLNIQPGAFCFYHAVVAQYFQSTTSSTVTFLGFDMLWTFWKMRPVYSTNEIKSKKLYLWIIIPWIVPLIAITGGLIYNHLTSPDAIKEEAGIFKYAHYRCSSPVWLVGTMIQSILFMLNILYFILTAFVILKTAYVSKFATKGSYRKFTSDSFHLLMKISLAMGLLIIATIFELMLGRDDPFAWYWTFNRSTIFGLHGLWLFLAFGLTQRNRKMLARKYGCLQWMTLGATSIATNSGTLNTTNRKQSSSTSRTLSSETNK